MDKMEKTLAFILDSENNISAICSKNDIWKYLRYDYRLSFSDRKSCDELRKVLNTDSLNKEVDTVIVGLKSRLIVGKGYTTMRGIEFVKMRVDNYEYFKKEGISVEKRFFKKTTDSELLIKYIETIDFDSVPKDSKHYIVFDENGLFYNICNFESLWANFIPEGTYKKIDYIRHYSYIRGKFKKLIKDDRKVSKCYMLFNRNFTHTDGVLHSEPPEEGSYDPELNLVMLLKSTACYLVGNLDSIRPELYKVIREADPIKLEDRLRLCTDPDSNIAVIYEKDSIIAVVDKNDIWKYCTPASQNIINISIEKLKKEFGNETIDNLIIEKGLPCENKHRIIVNSKDFSFVKDAERVITDKEPTHMVIEVNKAIYDFITENKEVFRSYSFPSEKYYEVPEKEYIDNIHPIEIWLDNNYRYYHGNEFRHGQLVVLEDVAAKFIRYSKAVVKYPLLYILDILRYKYSSRIVTVQGVDYLVYGL